MGAAPRSAAAGEPPMEPEGDMGAAPGSAAAGEPPMEPEGDMAAPGSAAAGEPPMEPEGDMGAAPGSAAAGDAPMEADPLFGEAVQQVAHLQATCLRVILQWVNQDQWTADQADQVIWLLQWMIWVQRNLTWMMQQLMALKILDQELPEPMAGDMDGDGMMPPPPTDDPIDDGMG